MGMTAMLDAPVETKYEGEISTLDETGDTKIRWDSSDDTSVAIAKAAFEAGKRAGHMAYKVVKGGENEQLREFDPTAEKIVMVPQIVGG